MALNRELLKYFTVKWTGLASVIDGLDPDDEPDLEYLRGVVTFTPNLPRGVGLKFQTIAEPFTVFPLKRKVPIEGGIFNDQSRPYIKLESPNLPFATPIDWNWRVDFDLYYGNVPVPVNSFNFTGDPDTVVDLTDVMPGTDPVRGIEITRGPRGTSIDGVRVENGNTFVFSLDDEFDTDLPPVEIPALTVLEDTLDAAAAAVAAAELANTDQVLALEHKNLATTAAATAVDAAELARQDRVAADSSKTAAKTSETNAKTSETNAKASETNADASKTAAQGARDTAVSARDAAIGARDTASGHATAAQQARTGAEIARTGAETAQAAAELARDQAQMGVVPDNAVGTAQLRDNEVTNAKLTQAARDSLGKADSAYQKPTNGIPKADLVSSVQDSLSKADAALPKASFPGDFVIVSHTGTRKVGGGDIGPQYIGKALRVDSVVYQFDTPDASGDTVVRLMNGNTEVVGSRLTISAANQVDGISTDAARTATLTDATRTYAKGGRLRLDVVSVGTTPGKGLRAWINCVWTQL